VPVVQGQPTPENKTWQYFHVEDFTPGCFDASNIATDDASQIPAPLGAAQADSTFCCMALASGGLGALPKMVESFSWETTFPLATTTLYLVGTAITPTIGGTGQPFVAMEGDNGTDHYYFASALDLTTNVLSLIVTIVATHQTGIFGSPYPFFTRASKTATPQLHPGTPILVFPAALTHDTHGNSGHVFVYPTPTNRGSYGVKDLVTKTVEIAGQTLGYSSRIVVLSGIAYVWPGGHVTGVNENISFTTPPNSYDLGNQAEWFVAETPFGYGAWGSVSTGELILIKKQGGGLVINGDIEDPSSAIYLPGIQPTGDFVGKAGASEQGLYYCSEDRGAWLWNGGNTSSKISQQLRDAFYDVTSTVIASNNYGFFVARWGSWILFSGNWLYNPTQGSWWTLYPQAANGTSRVPGVNLFWFNQGTFGHQMWANPISITKTVTTKWLWKFTNKIDAPHWQWTSQPIHVTPNADHVVDVRRVIVRVSCPSGTAHPTLTVKIGTFTATTTVTIGTAVQAVRFNVGLGAHGLNDIVLQLNGDQTTATDDNVIVHSVDVAYQIRAHVASDN
jgi:hypothetical protein